MNFLWAQGFQLTASDQMPVEMSMNEKILNLADPIGWNGRCCARCRCLHGARELVGHATWMLLLSTEIEPGRDAIMLRKLAQIEQMSKSEEMGCAKDLGSPQLSEKEPATRGLQTEGVSYES